MPDWDYRVLGTQILLAQIVTKRRVRVPKNSLTSGTCLACQVAVQIAVLTVTIAALPRGENLVTAVHAAVVHVSGVDRLKVLLHGEVVPETGITQVTAHRPGELRVGDVVIVVVVVVITV